MTTNQAYTVTATPFGDIRHRHHEGFGERVMDTDSLATFLLTLNASDSTNPDKRAALERYQREAALVTGAPRRRLLAQLMDAIGQQQAARIILHTLGPRDGVGAGSAK